MLKLTFLVIKSYDLKLLVNEYLYVCTYLIPNDTGMYSYYNTMRNVLIPLTDRKKNLQSLV